MVMITCVVPLADMSILGEDPKTPRLDALPMPILYPLGYPQQQTHSES